jgi:hypothetical protein
VHYLLGPANFGLAAFGMNAEWHVLGRGQCRRYVVDRSDTQYLPVVQVQYAELGTAEPGGISQHGLENRLELARRRANDL